MATKKAAAKPAPSQKSTGVTGANDGAPEYDPNELRRALDELCARHARVDDAHREAFDSLSNNAKRADLGGRTRATGVLRDGVSWAVQIDQAFVRYGALVDEHYSKERFSYFMDRLRALELAVAGQGTSRDGTSVKRAASEERDKAARDARNKLIEKMTRVAGERNEKTELEQAVGTAEKLGVSILSLVTLGRAWLARKDPTLAILCKSARLTEDLLRSTLAAGEALAGAATDVTLAGRKRSADSPEVNVLEGWVLSEMAEAQRAFDAVHEESRLVPRLSPGPSTRQVLGVRKTGATNATDPQPSPDNTARPT